MKLMKNTVSSFVLTALASQLVLVHAFTPSSLSPSLVVTTTQSKNDLRLITATSIGNTSNNSKKLSHSSPLFVQQNQFHTHHRQHYQQQHRNVIWKTFLSIINPITSKLRRQLIILLTSTLLFLAPISITPQNAHASSSIATPPPTTTTSTKITSKSQQRLNKLIDNYVYNHMFNDDQYDPLESTYREIISDSTSSTSTNNYPNKLSSIASNLGTTQISTSSSSSSSLSSTTTSSDGIMKSMLKLVNTIEQKYNIPRSIIVPTLALLSFAIPSFIIAMSLLSFSYAQRGMTERMAIDRYGESVLDAEEVVVEEEDDDDDGYDYETGEYEDDDEDDDDDDDDDNKDDDNGKK